jgi:hypothetical protein
MYFLKYNKQSCTLKLLYFSNKNSKDRRRTKRICSLGTLLWILFVAGPPKSQSATTRRGQRKAFRWKFKGTPPAAPLRCRAPSPARRDVARTGRPGAMNGESLPFLFCCPRGRGGGLPCCPVSFRAGEHSPPVQWVQCSRRWCYA